MLGKCWKNVGYFLFRGEFIDLMKHSTPFEDGKENGVIGDANSWVHYNWPEAQGDPGGRFFIDQ